MEDTLLDLTRPEYDSRITGMLSNVSRSDIKRQVEYLLKAQAEISFNAGEKQGIREVVECVNGFMVLHSPRMWQAKLKEWRIEQ